MRAIAFRLVSGLLSLLYLLAALPALALPGRGPVRAIIASYTRAMVLALRLVGGVRREVRGREHLPSGPFILAPKHQSWGDGYLVYPEIPGLTFVTGDHLERFPLVGGILRKLGAIVIDTCGGGDRKAASLSEGVARAGAQDARILIYPEGHLAPVGYHFRYKSGVWHMARVLKVPVVPMATSLGVFWPQQEGLKRTGTAVIEFLAPIAHDLPREEFLACLTEAVETRTAALIAEATGTAPQPATLIPDPPNGMEARPSPDDLTACRRA